MTHNLTYIGADPAVVGVVPLPENWPAANHEEPDAAIFAEKIAHGSYRTWRTTDGDEPQYNEGVSEGAASLGSTVLPNADTAGTVQPAETPPTPDASAS